MPEHSPPGQLALATARVRGELDRPSCHGDVSIAAEYTFSVFELAKLDAVPLTYIRVEGAPSDDELTDTLSRIAQSMKDDLRQHKRSVNIMDMRRASVISASQRRASSVWMKEHTPLFEQSCMGAVFIIASPLVRGVLTALLWFQPMKLPHHVVADLDAAVRWAIELFDRENVEVPERVRRELGRVFDS
jgi:hypothetical protein